MNQTIAENILIIDGSPLAFMQEFLEHNQIQETLMVAVSLQDIYESILLDFNYLLNSITACAETFNTANIKKKQIIKTTILSLQQWIIILKIQ